jgi:DNA-binding transcriptional LysR family regulator
MELAALKAFQAVAESGSFSKAGEILFLTQPAVSKRIASLEDGLGLKLFDRIGKHISLTEAGRTLLPEAQKILSQVDESKRLLANLSNRVGGSLHIATSHHIGLHRLPAILQNFTHHHPDVDLELSFMDSEKALRLIEIGKLELAIVTLPEDATPLLKTTPAWKDELVFVCGKNHALAKLKKVNLKTLSQHRALLPSQGTITRKIIESHLTKRDLSLNVTMETNYLETIQKMVEIGLGWNALPKTMANKRLTILSIPNIRLQRTLGIVQHKSRTLSNAAQALLKFIPQTDE